MASCHFCCWIAVEQQVRELILVPTPHYRFWPFTHPNATIFTSYPHLSRSPVFSFPYCSSTVSQPVFSSLMLSKVSVLPINCLSVTLRLSVLTSRRGRHLVGDIVTADSSIYTVCLLSWLARWRHSVWNGRCGWWSTWSSGLWRPGRSWFTQTNKSAHGIPRDVAVVWVEHWVPAVVTVEYACSVSVLACIAPVFLHIYVWLHAQLAYPIVARVWCLAWI